MNGRECPDRLSDPTDGKTDAVGGRCHCGQPLHYTVPAIQEFVERMIAAKGETVVIRVFGQRGWKVPRHYIALHGLKASEIETLGFEEVP